MADPAVLVGVISDQKTVHSIPYRTSCRALCVSEAWFYKWRRRPSEPTKREIRRAELAERIRCFFDRSGRTYGSPRITLDHGPPGRPEARRSAAAGRPTGGAASRSRCPCPQTHRQQPHEGEHTRHRQGSRSCTIQQPDTPIRQPPTTHENTQITGYGWGSRHPHAFRRRCGHGGRSPCLRAGERLGRLLCVPRPQSRTGLPHQPKRDEIPLTPTLLAYGLCCGGMYDLTCAG